MSKIKLLLADDLPDHLDNWKKYIATSYIKNLQIDDYYEKEDVYNALQKGNYDVIVLDLDWSEGGGEVKEGLNMIQRAKEVTPNSEVIIVTGKGAGDNFGRIKEAFRLGAMDYISKETERYGEEHYRFEFIKSLNNAIEKVELRRKSQVPFFAHVFEDFKISKASSLGDLEGKSETMRILYSIIRKLSEETSTLLLLGETGVGKSLIARTIHNNSPTKTKPFVEFTPTEFPEHLREATLFGWKKGAFTDATYNYTGLIKEAEGGTLFIDEIGIMPMELQVKLLRFLDTKEIRPLAGKTIPVKDVRLICATNSKIYQMVEEGGFRQDLFYRVGAFPIVIPPLREHLEDIPVLVNKFINKFVQDKKEISLTDGALKKLTSHNWPGNVRELENVIRRTLFLTTSSDISEDKIIFDYELHNPGTNIKKEIKSMVITLFSSMKDSKDLKFDNLPELKDKWGVIITKEVVICALKETKGNLKKSGILLGFYKGNIKDEDPEDYQKYEKYRQYVTNQLKIKAKFYK